jgi:hypothetical protein
MRDFLVAFSAVLPAELHVVAPTAQFLADVGLLSGLLLARQFLLLLLHPLPLGILLGALLLRQKSD